jgi:hypothetical protein
MNNMKNTISKGTMNTPRHFTNLFTHVTRTRLNNVLRLATLAAACLALPTHALAQSMCRGDLNDDGEVNSADVGSLQRQALLWCIQVLGQLMAILLLRLLEQILLAPQA